MGRKFLKYVPKGASRKKSSKKALGNEDIPDKVPASNDELPASSDELPASSNKVLAHNDELPASSDEIPAHNDELPVNSKEVPVNIKEVPVNSKEIPVNSKEVPVNIKEVPVNSKEVPVNIMDIGPTKDKSTQCDLLYNPEEETVAKKPIMCDASCQTDSYITEDEPAEDVVDKPQNLCEGNPDAKFHPLILKHQGVFTNLQGKCWQ